MSKTTRRKSFDARTKHYEKISTIEENIDELLLSSSTIMKIL